jgi:DNA polymerase
LNINQFQNETKKDLLANIKNNNKKIIKNIIATEKKQEKQFLNDYDDIDVLEILLKNYNVCDLKKTATNFVKFQGSKNADLLFIDGTPDTEEDKVGRFFVSEKGVLFDKMLNAINLRKDDIFIVNAIPWRPPGNRYPTEEEIKICRPFIFNLIRLLKPKIIVCLGEISTNQILDLNQSVIKTRGKWHSLKSNSINNFDEEYNPYVLPTLNISYLLTRPDMKRQAWEDMKLLRDKIREI